MLIDPSLEQLLTKADSKFSIVSMVAKRVRQLNDGWKSPLTYDADTKLVSLALREIAEGVITMDSGEVHPEDIKEEVKNV